MFSLKTQQTTLKQSTMSLTKAFNSSPRKKTVSSDNESEVIIDTDSFKTDSQKNDRKKSSTSDSEEKDKINPMSLTLLNRPS